MSCLCGCNIDGKLKEDNVNITSNIKPEEIQFDYSNPKDFEIKRLKDENEKAKRIIKKLWENKQTELRRFKEIIKKWK